MTRLLFLVAITGCNAPQIADTFTQLDVTIVDDALGTNNEMIYAARQAETSLHVGLPSLNDDVLAQEIADAYLRGVDVEVVLDIDQQFDDGVSILEDADVPLTFADGALTYFDFAALYNVEIASENVIMSHAYVVRDRIEALTATHAGDLYAGPRVLFRATGEDLIEDILSEHLQVFGGADAQSTTAFDSLAKSIADNRWAYPTNEAMVPELWFGPQERLTKRVIDAVYSARSSVKILTDDFSNLGLARAMQSKAQFGFPIEIVVGPRFGLANTTNAEFLRSSTEDVVKWRWLAGADEGTVEIPTIVLIDVDESASRNRNNPQAMVLTHDLYAAAREFGSGGEPLPGYVSDQVIDGMLWVLSEPGAPSETLLQLDDLFDEFANTAEELE
jgi:hypothetical protein